MRSVPCGGKPGEKTPEGLACNRRRSLKGAWPEHARCFFRSGRPGLTTQASVLPGVGRVLRGTGEPDAALPPTAAPVRGRSDRDARGTDVPRTSKALMPNPVRACNKISTTQCTFFVCILSTRIPPSYPQRWGEAIFRRNAAFRSECASRVVRPCLFVRRGNNYV